MSPQQTIAHYRIVSKLGEGGMGAVYRATDTKLNREVAIKVLPDAFATDPDRLARFTREAQVLASLNHPNIAHIYGVEDRALIMELVEGEELKGPLSEAEALPLIQQLIDALEYAHEKGIIHRDLKPANIKVTPEGQLKVLDFGLAKAITGDPATAGDPASSPTLTMSATMAGALMGTAAYMAPEQARGKTADKRADIWAFGAIVYELLTGRRLFDGETISDTLAAVLTRDPDLTDVPPRFRRLLRLCLQRDPRQRLRDIGDARPLLEETPAALAPAMVQPRSKLPWVAAAALGCVALAAVPWALRAPPSASRPLVRLPIDLSDGSPESVAVSPDGRRIAYTTRDLGVIRLNIRQLDQDKGVVVPSSQRAAWPFFSPDSQWVAFFSLGRLAKVNVDGGEPTTVTPVNVGLLQGSGAWGPDGTIVYTVVSGTGLYRVSASGGSPKPLTDPTRHGQVWHRWPQFLPGGKTVLFTGSTSKTGLAGAEIDALNLATGDWRTVQKNGYFGRYAPSGHLFYLRESSLFAVRFDPDRLETSGPPVQVMTEVAGDSTIAQSLFDCSAEGSSGGLCLVWNGQSASESYNASWIEPGTEQQIFARAQVYLSPRISPDGRLLAIAIGGAAGDIHIWDSTRETLTQLTFTRAYNMYPVFTPDGRHLVYSAGDNHTDLWWVRTDGGGAPEKLYSSQSLMVPCSFSPDGGRLAFFTVREDTRQDLWTLPIDASDPDHPKAKDPEPFLVSPSGDSSPMFSPDGHWIAYNSDESGSMEVYVRPFPGPGGKWRISSGGGTWASWSRDGKRLYYVNRDDAIYYVDYAVRGETFEAGKPALWSEPRARARHTSSFRNWDMAPDGRRAVMFTEPEGQSPAALKLSVVFNLFDELKRRLP